MLNVEKLKKEEYIQIQEMAEDIVCASSAQIEKEFPQYFAEAGKSLWYEIKAVHEKYIKLEKENQVKELEWIYLSFLRTGLLDGSPCYRIDLYDLEGCISEVVCTGNWDFHYVFDFYYRAEKEIMDRLKRQTRLSYCEIEDILWNLLDFFRKTSDRLIKQMIHDMHSDFEEIMSGGHAISIMLGDYLDEAELVEDV